jgi:hypothetical protein
MKFLPLTGGCQCGAVRYEVTSPPLNLVVCHCRDCQKQSTSAFGISVLFLAANVRLLKGEMKSWPRRTGSGRTLNCFLCPTCGSRIWDCDPEYEEDMCIKGGSLDEPLDLNEAIHIWTSRKAPGVMIPEQARQFAEGPG